MSRFMLVLATLLLAAPVCAQTNEDDGEDHGPPVLFDSHEAIEFTLEADFDQLKDDREEESEELPAVIKWTKADGTMGEEEMQVRTRGIFRLQRSTCRDMPPIRLNFRTGGMEGTVFQGQDKVKLVTFCRDGDNDEQDVLEEYLAYRILNELTENSFQARLARITYVDTSGEEDPITRYGFMIEAEEAVAARLNATQIDAPHAPPDQVDGENAIRLAVFQYLIGNTDWSAVYFHNVRLYRLADGTYITIPYDFDMAGLIDARYAVPDGSLGLRNVRQRLYRGYCRSNADYRGTYARFIEKKQALFDLVMSIEGFEDDKKEDAIEYIEDFYETIEDEGRAEDRIEEACRRL